MQLTRMTCRVVSNALQPISGWLMKYLLIFGQSFGKLHYSRVCIWPLLARSRKMYPLKSWQEAYEIIPPLRTDCLAVDVQNMFRKQTVRHCCPPGSASFACWI